MQKWLDIAHRRPKSSNIDFPLKQALFPDPSPRAAHFCLKIVSAVVSGDACGRGANRPQMAINSRKQAQKVSILKNDKKLLKNNNKLSKNNTAHPCTNAHKTVQKCKK